MIVLVDKKEVISGWPLETGDYSVGNSNSPVAVVSLGSKMNDELVELGAAIAGPLHTENLGIEKVVANIVSNSNIRFLVVCGSEVQGHITGQTVEALYENGIDGDTKSINGSQGAIPFVENLTIEAIERFQKQIVLVNMIDNENLDEIADKINECINNDPGAYEQEAIIVELNDKEEESSQEEYENEENISQVGVDETSIQLIEIETRIRSIHSEVKQVASSEKLTSGYCAGKIEGMVFGFILTLILVIVITIGM